MRCLCPPSSLPQGFAPDEIKTGDMSVNRDVDGDASGASAGASPFQKVRVVTTIDFYLD